MNTRIGRCRGALFGVLPLAVLAASAHAQVAGYDVIDLGVLPASTDPKSGAWAINDRHEIVGWATDASATSHAAIWLYCENYGLAAGVWHDLTILGGESDQGEAFDINMSGLIVGRQMVSTSSGVFRAFIWDVASSPFATTELGTFAGGATTSGFATAINDSDPAIVVGTAQAPGGCFGTQRFEAFSYKYGDSTAALTLLGSNSGDRYSAGSGVNNALPPQISGRSTDEHCQNSICRDDHDAVVWELAPSTLLTTLLDNGEEFGAQGWAINDAGHIVGFAHSATASCEWQAAYWETAASTPLNIGVIGLPASAESRAFRISEAGPMGEVTVVGDDHSDLHAYRWYRDDAGTWSGADLNDLISPLCDCTLTEAHDVSSAGWIVGDGFVNVPGFGARTHGFLLKPITCPGDIDGSCSVSAGDLGILLGVWAWGSASSACSADINRDGTIDGGDLGLLLDAWGSTCECWECSSAHRGSAESESSSEADTETERLLFEGLSILGFDSLDEFNAWRRSRSDTDALQTLNWLYVYLTARN